MEALGLIQDNKWSINLTGFAEYLYLFEKTCKGRMLFLQTASKGASVISPTFGWRWQQLFCMALQIRSPSESALCVFKILKVYKHYVFFSSKMPGVFWIVISKPITLPTMTHQDG